RKQRNTYDWSQADVARALHLSVKQVEAIERDDYDSLPGATYIQGYWQSYARLLEIDISDAVNAHKHLLASHQSSIAPKPNHQQIRGNEEQSRRRVALLFCVLLSVFLGAVWFWSTPNNQIENTPGFDKIAKWFSLGQNSVQNGQSGSALSGGNTVSLLSIGSGEPDPLPTGEQNSLTESVISLPEPNFTQETVGDENDTDDVTSINSDDANPIIEISVSGQKKAANEQGTDSEASTSELSAQAPETPPVSAESNSGDELPQPEENIEVSTGGREGSGALGAQNQSNADSAESLGNALESDPELQLAAADSAAANPQTTKSVSPDHLHIQLNRETWLDVRNFKGEKLVYQTYPERELVSVRGVPPFYVFIGSAEGVEVTYRGEVFPFELNQNGSFARFTVGKE
ncbi:MAG: RodZ domain-containing protein, partial [Pseudomonadota bacterium]